MSDCVTTLRSDVLWGYSKLGTLSNGAHYVLLLIVIQLVIQILEVY